MHSLHLVISGVEEASFPWEHQQIGIDRQIHDMQVNGNDKADPTHVSYLSFSFLIYQTKNLDCSKIADFHANIIFYQKIKD